MRVWSSNLPAAREIAARIQAGTPGSTSTAWLNPRIPFGGAKQSGHGLEFGVEGPKALRIYSYVWGRCLHRPRDIHAAAFVVGFDLLPRLPLRTSGQSPCLSEFPFGRSFPLRRALPVGSKHLQVLVFPDVLTCPGVTSSPIRWSAAAASGSASSGQVPVSVLRPSAWR